MHNAILSIGKMDWRWPDSKRKLKCLYKFIGENLRIRNILSKAKPNEPNSKLMNFKVLGLGLVIFFKGKKQEQPWLVSKNDKNAENLNTSN